MEIFPEQLSGVREWMAAHPPVMLTLAVTDNTTINKAAILPFIREKEGYTHHTSRVGMGIRSEATSDQVGAQPAWGLSANLITIPLAHAIPTLDVRAVYHFMVMKPQALRPELGEVKFQICKGTRLCADRDESGALQVRDMDGKRDAHLPLEPLPETALREGLEEIGLQFTNIRTLFDCGKVFFTSAKTGKQKSMYLYAAEILNKEDFSTPSVTHATTAAVRWMMRDEFTQQGRGDHALILERVDKILREYLTN